MCFFVTPTNIWVRVVTLGVFVGVIGHAIAPNSTPTSLQTAIASVSAERFVGRNRSHPCEILPTGCDKGGSR
jgi:hypothetical protein